MGRNLNSLIKEHIEQTFVPENNKVFNVDVEDIREEVLSDISSDSKLYKNASGLKKAITQKAKQVYLRMSHGDVSTIKDKESFIEMLFKSSTYSLRAKNEKHIIMHKCKNNTCPIKYFNNNNVSFPKHNASESINKIDVSMYPVSRTKCAKCINQVFDNPNMGKLINQTVDALNNKEQSDTGKRTFPKHIQKHIDQNMKGKGFNFNKDHKAVAILYMLHLFDNNYNFIDYRKAKKVFDVEIERYRTAGQALFNMGYIHQQDLSKLYQTELNKGGLIDCIKGVQANRAIGAMVYDIHAIKKKYELYERNEELRPANYREIIREYSIYQNAIEFFSRAGQSMTLKELIKEFRSRLN